MPQRPMMRPRRVHLRACSSVYLRVSDQLCKHPCDLAYMRLCLCELAILVCINYIIMHASEHACVHADKIKIIAICVYVFTNLRMNHEATDQSTDQASRRDRI